LLGGACVTEEVWPGYRVSRASYVVSMLQPKVVADLRLRAHGYEPIPLDPAYATVADGTPVFFHDHPAAAGASIARVSPRDAAAYPSFMALLERGAALVRPLLLKPPPDVGSRHPADLPSFLARAGRRAARACRARGCTRLMTMVRGLYLCGAGTHPGGGVMGASDHNAAMRGLRDRRRARLRRRLRSRVW
jgi:phytoene dehydrogenase-like protein